MKTWLILPLLALLVAGVAIPILAGEDEGKDDDAKHKAEVSKKVAAALAKVKFTLADACTTAEKEAKGKAVAAKLEIDDDEIEYEVIVAVVDGEKVEFKEVDVDAVTGKVLAEEDDDDDEEDEDEEHHDDDDKHEKGEEHGK